MPPTSMRDNHLYILKDGTAFVKIGEVEDDDLQSVKEGEMRIFGVKDNQFIEIDEHGAFTTIQDRTEVDDDDIDLDDDDDTDAGDDGNDIDDDDEE